MHGPACPSLWWAWGWELGEEGWAGRCGSGIPAAHWACSGLPPNRGRITPCQAPGSLFVALSGLGPNTEQPSAQALQSSPSTLWPPSQRGLQPTGTPWVQPPHHSARISLSIFTNLPTASLLSPSPATHSSSAQSISSRTCPPGRAGARLWAVLSQSCPSSPARAQSRLQAHVGTCWWVLEQFQVLQN